MHPCHFDVSDDDVYASSLCGAYPGHTTTNESHVTCPDCLLLLIKWDNERDEPEELTAD